MGLNVNLCRMLNVPETTLCPACQSMTPTGFKDYDIECGNPNPKMGLWKLDIYCEKCETSFPFQFTIRPSLI